MAEYRFSLQKAVSRGKGQSATAKAAYNAREQLHDDHKGQFTRDYGKPTKNSGGKDDILFAGIFLDTKLNPPEWATNRNPMWNAQVASEKRKDAREAQEIIVNLPWEFTQKQREYMLTDFSREITRGTGRIADVNMHKAPKHGDDRNIHAHILLTVREIGQDGFTGKRLEVTPEQLDNWKEKWAARGARELRKAGFSLEADRWTVGHLTKEKQCEAALKRLDLEHAATLTGAATKHLGPEAAAMERNGKGSDRSDIHREDFTAGQEMVKLKRELALVEKKILTEILAMQREPRGGDKQTILRPVDQIPGGHSDIRSPRFWKEPGQLTVNDNKSKIPEKERATAPNLGKAAKLAKAVRSVLAPGSSKPPVSLEKAGTDAERIAATAKIDLSKYRPERKGQQDQKPDVSQKPPDRDRER